MKYKIYKKVSPGEKLRNRVSKEVVTVLRPSPKSMGIQGWFTTDGVNWHNVDFFQRKKNKHGH